MGNAVSGLIGIKSSLDERQDIKKTKKRQRDAINAANDARTAERKSARDRQRQRIGDVARNKTLIGDPLGVGGRVQAIRKVLTGE